MISGAAVGTGRAGGRIVKRLDGANPVRVDECVAELVEGRGTRPAGADWRAFARAMGKTGAGSLASGLLSGVAIKIVAAMLGPAAVALVATLQQIQRTALSAATLNGQTALVQGASSFRGRKRREFLRTALGLFAMATLGVAVAMIGWPAGIARLAGLPVEFTNLVRWLAISMVLASVFTFASSLLRAMPEVDGVIGRLAVIQVVAALAMALACWPAAMAARAGHTGALVAMLGVSAGAAASGAVIAIASRREILATLFGAAFGKAFGRARVERTLLPDGFDRARFGSVWFGSVWFRRSKLGAACAGEPGQSGTFQAARHFFAISGAMLATSLLGSAALLAVRARVTRISGSASTGQFDAAWGISMNHVALVLAAMQVYYLPVLGAARDASERRRHIANGLTLAICAAVPIIVGIALAKPAVISLLYSSAFHPAGRLLRWTLVGDYLKVTSWALAVPMLAAADMRWFMAADVSTQTAFWSGAWLVGHVNHFSLNHSAAEAAAIAFLFSYAVNFAVCYFYARSRQGFRFGPRIAGLWTGGLLLVCAASLGVTGI
jgi:O-antigen/teichoic acid export membrane protein